MLDRHVLKDGRSAVFVYAPGISDGKTLDPARIQALTGTPFKTPGVSEVVREGWTAVYADAYEALTPQVLRRLAVRAGVTIYCDDAVPVYANERLVAIHMAKGGERTITLPKPCREVRELYTGRVIPVADKKFRYTFATPDTALFEMIP